MNQPSTFTLTALAALVAFVLAGCGNMSERQKGTATAPKAGTGAAVGGVVAGNLWSRRMEDKRRAMERATQGTGIEVVRTPDNQLKLNVPGDLSFSGGRADLRPPLRPVLEQFAQGLDGSTRVVIVGHGDSTGGAVNDPLSMQRAQTVRDYLALRGVPASRLEIAGRGAREPLADNGTESGRARNRRVELFLREPQA